MFHDAHPGCGTDQRRCRRNIECAADIAAGAASVDDDAAIVAGDWHRLFAHDRCGADKFFNGRPLRRQSHQQSADLRIRRFAGHDVCKSLAGLIAREVFASTEFEQKFLQRHGVHCRP
jgi:hypothetical protein